MTDSTNGSCRGRYLELLKDALTFSLWQEPGVAIEHQYAGPVWRLVYKALSALTRSAGPRLSLAVSEEQRQFGRVWPAYAHTMIGRKRLDHLQYCIESVLREGVPGDLIETGVWRGGAAILMRAVLAAHAETQRRVFVADSFRGLPAPDVQRYPQDRGDVHHTIDFLSVSRAQVEENFRLYNLLDEQVIFLEGWFEETLPTAPIERLAILRFDGDMYQSTVDVMMNLYDKLSVGGYCIIDDYSLPGCRQAVDDFRAAREINAPIQRIDWTGVYWRKWPK